MLVVRLLIMCGCWEEFVGYVLCKCLICRRFHVGGGI